MKTFCISAKIQNSKTLTKFWKNLSFSIFLQDRFHGDKQDYDMQNPDSDSDKEDPDFDIKLSYLDSDDEKEVGPKPLPEDFKWKRSKLDMILRTVQTICDLITTFPECCEMVPQNNNKDWTQTLATFYILGTVAADWHINTHHKIRQPISEAFRVMLDHFPKDAWLTYGPSGKKVASAPEDSVSNDITEALTAVGAIEGESNSIQ